jgi:hypothetical protein
VANSFGTDILIQAPDPKSAADFYVHGPHINLFIERGPALGPVLEVTVDNVAEARLRLLQSGCEVIKDEPDVPRCYFKDPFGLIYNVTS